MNVILGGEGLFKPSGFTSGSGFIRFSFDRHPAQDQLPSDIEMFAILVESDSRIISVEPIEQLANVVLEARENVVLVVHLFCL